MTDLINALFKEAEKNPLASFLVIGAAIFAFVFFVFIWPKRRKEQLSSQKELADRMSSNNEIIRHSSAVIENNSRALANNTQAMELTRQAIGNVCDRMDQLHERFEDHDRNAIAVLNKTTEIVAILRK